MRLSYKFRLKDVPIFKFDLNINYKKLSWFECRLLGVGIDVDYKGEYNAKKWVFYSMTLDLRHLIIPRIKQYIRKGIK